MSNTKNIKSTIAMSVLVFAQGSSSLAETGTTDFEFGLGVPYFQFDSAYDVEEETGVRGVAGFRRGNLQFELNYDNVTTAYESAASQADYGPDLDVEQLYGNILLFGKPWGNLDPFISGGLGQANFESTNVDEETTVATVGAGFKYYISENFNIRPALNYFIPTELEENYATASLTFSYLTGKPSSYSAKKKVNVAAQVDTDNDGVVDIKDRCSGTPSAVLVDASGCAVDSDSDGVADYLDKCESTATNLRVDESGCPIKLEKTVEIDLNVNFDSNSDVVKSQYYSEIRRVSEFMSQYENTRVVIEGHTDTQGSAAYNRALSQKRAEAVAKVLVSEMNVSSSRVRAIGYGEERPLTRELSAADLEANRRVVAKISAKVETLREK